MLLFSRTFPITITALVALMSPHSSLSSPLPGYATAKPSAFDAPPPILSERTYSSSSTDSGYQSADNLVTTPPAHTRQGSSGYSEASISSDEGKIPSFKRHESPSSSAKVVSPTGAQPSKNYLSSKDVQVQFETYPWELAMTMIMSGFKNSYAGFYRLGGDVFPYTSNGVTEIRFAKDGAFYKALKRNAIDQVLYKLEKHEPKYILFNLYNKDGKNYYNRANAKRMSALTIDFSDHNTVPHTLEEIFKYGENSKVSLSLKESSRKIAPPKPMMRTKKEKDAMLNALSMIKEE
ncbi:MAG: hypothetical protein DHS80DRAFT_25748 [Piptocephalis tieghemiana]|nr:MAG: hypothetical protein DHS80DRAFT_25748 [Piptocephalis tieghemiana]